MMLQQSKEWYEKHARNEGDAEIGAGNILVKENVPCVFANHESAEIEALRAENKRLRSALEPFGVVGRLPSIRRHPDGFLWSRDSNIDNEVIRIRATDAIKAAEVLASTNNKSEE